MEFVIYTLFVIAAMLIASELNAVTHQSTPVMATPQPTPIKAMAKAQPAPPRLVISLDDQPDPDSEDPANYDDVWYEFPTDNGSWEDSEDPGYIVDEEAPIEWHLFGLRELRQIAKSLGVKGFGRMNTANVKAAIEAAIK